MLLTLVALALGGADARPCVTMNTARLPLATRQSPLDSVSVRLAGGEVKICYGRPAARGRTMIGGPAVPFGQLWRTGANEPTVLHTEVPLVVAGIRVAPGSYSLYTIPGPTEWEIILNRSLAQWGRENYYTEEVRAREVGRGKAPVQALRPPVERFTIRLQASGAARGQVLLEWETTRVTIPIQVAGS